jgi:hypothetical protein
MIIAREKSAFLLSPSVKVPLSRMRSNNHHASLTFSILLRELVSLRTSVWLRAALTCWKS